MKLFFSNNELGGPRVLGSGSWAKVAVFAAGVQKGGTTSLFSYLSRHPQLSAPARKEPHFFDDEARNWDDPDYGDLHAWFAGAPSRRLRFDATPIYSFWAPAPDRIWRYNPGARIILVFRDPVERAVSQWRMERGRGTESLSFSEAVRSEPARLAAPFGKPAWREKSYVARGRYGEQLARILARFPRHQVLCLRSDDLHNDHHRSLSCIADFLGVAPFPDLPAAHEFAGTHTEPVFTEDRAYVQRLLRDDLHVFAMLSGLDVADWLAE